MTGSRRKFLENTIRMGSAIGAERILSLGGRWATLGIGTGISTACSSLDHYLMGETGENQEKLAIIGAGLSGLSAAVACRKERIPFRIYEASDRLGGRAFSLTDFNLSAQVLELGGEWILPNHNSIIALAKEMRVNLKEKKMVEAYAVPSFVGKNQTRITLSKLTAIFRRVYSEAFGGAELRLKEENKDFYPKALVLHKISGLEFCRRLQKEVGEDFQIFLSDFSHFVWGAELDQVSALSLVQGFLEPNAVTATRLFHFQGGSSVLSRAMFDRLSGVLPGQFVRFSHQLASVSKDKKGWYELEFETPWGGKTIRAQNVICTLPLSCLSEVKGLDEIGIPERTLKWIKQKAYGDHAKMGLSFQEAKWRRHPIYQQSHKWLLGGKWYTIGVEPTLNLGNSRGVISVLVGGSKAKETGLHTAQEILSELAPLKVETWKYEDIFAIRNWRSQKWSKGSIAIPGPDESLMEFSDFQTSQGGWIFAGEHTERVGGSMNAAVESGVRAAQQVAKRITS